MSKKNADGTYDLPDEKVSLVWQSAAGQLLRRSTNGTYWTGLVDCHEETPLMGRWLPWSPPTFPVREKCEVRLCLVKIKIHDSAIFMASWHMGKGGVAMRYPFKVVLSSGHEETFSDEHAEFVKWLSPEYKDELPK